MADALLVPTSPNLIPREQNASMIDADKTRALEKMDHVINADQEPDHSWMGTHVKPIPANQVFKSWTTEPAKEKKRWNVMEDRSLTIMADAKTAKIIPDHQGTEKHVHQRNAQRTKSCWKVVLANIANHIQKYQMMARGVLETLAILTKSFRLTALAKTASTALFQPVVATIVNPKIRVGLKFTTLSCKTRSLKMESRSNSQSMRMTMDRTF